MQKGLLSFTKKHFCLVAGLLCIQFSSGQGLINNGAQIVITNTSNIYIDGATGNLTNQAGGTITNNSSGGKIILGGNWVNNAVISIDKSTVEFNGATAQSIGGSIATGFYNINASGNGVKTFITSESTLSNLLKLGTLTTVDGGGKLTLLATATSNANVDIIPSGSAIIGNVYVQVYFSGGSDAHRGTRSISSPVTEAVSTTYSQLKNYMVITGAANGGFDPGGAAQPNGTSLTVYNEAAKISQSQFTPVTSLSQPLDKGRGAFLFFRGDRTNYTPQTALISNKVNAPFAIPENVEMKYYGPVNQQDVVVSVPFTSNGEGNYDGYDLIGNPYPAVIDWNKVAKSNMSTDFRIIKPTGGFITYLNGVLAGTAGWTGDPFHILPGQAFYARAASAPGGSVTFTENAKSLVSAPIRLMYSPKDNQFSTLISSVNPRTSSISSRFKELRITLQNDKNIEEAVTVFKSGSNAVASSEDGVLFGGSSIALSTLSSDNIKLTINFMPEIEEVQELKLSVSATGTGPVKLNFTDLAAIDHYEAFLHDSYLSTSVNVRDAQTYEFVIDRAVPESYGNDRLKLVLKPLSPASNLMVKKASSGAELAWILSSTANYGNFTIERSEDGTNFTTIGNVDYLPSLTSYTFLDKSPIIGTNHYRLKQLDKKGNTILSKPVSLEYQLPQDIPFVLYPNPTVDWINIDMNERNSSLVLTIHNLSGSEVMKKTFLKDQSMKENVSALGIGVYILKLTTETGNELIGTAKFIKE